MPMKTEIAPLLIMTKLEQYDYAGATAIAVVMLVASFVLLLAINVLQCWSAAAGRRAEHGRASRPAQTRFRAPVSGLILVGARLSRALPGRSARPRSSSEALAKGVAAYLAALREPETLAALRLTLLTAAIAVPANLLFGMAAAWAIAKFDFPGQERPHHA